MSLKIRTKLITAFLVMLIPLAVFVLINRYNHKDIYLAAHKVAELQRKISTLSDLQIALDMLIMPANDYLITGDIGKREEFQRLASEIESYLGSLSENMRCKNCHEITDEMVRRLYDVEPNSYWSKEMVFVNVVKGYLRKISEKAEGIFDKGRDAQLGTSTKEGARLMEEMDAIAHKVIKEDILRQRREDEKELLAATMGSEKAWGRSWLLMAGGLIISTAFGIGFAFFYSGLFIRPIEAIRKGADVIASGDFRARVDVKTGDEIEQLANTMNEMAAQLQNFYSTLEEQVAERTRELIESEERYHSLFENMLDGFAYCKMLFDDQGRPVDFVYLDVNASFERLTGLKNVVGKQVTEVIPGIKESHPDLFDIYSRVALTGKPERFEIDFKPLAIWLYISVYSTKNGYFAAVFDNITERKKSEEKLKEQLDELQRWKMATVGRELRMKELKDENEMLKGRIEELEGE